jgi:hypothetical protein
MTDKAELEKPDGLSLVLNFLPLLQLAAGAYLCWSVVTQTGPRLAFAAAWVYLLPPLVARLACAVFGTPDGELTQGMRGYRVWWLLTQWQTPFNRLPWLEEVLRLVPGLYALWIGLWGGHLSPYAYVGPGVILTDRYLVRVERGAVLGFKSTLAAHMVVRNAAGRYRVVVAAPWVQAEALVGGFAGLGPGAVLKAGQLLPVGRYLGPYAVWPRPAPGDAVA